MDVREGPMHLEVRHLRLVARLHYPGLKGQSALRVVSG